MKPENRGISDGPWEVEPRPDPWFDLHIWGPGGRLTGEHIATVNTEANAALMAAAPDLLAACRAALSVIVHLDYLGGNSVEAKQITNAIEKATNVK